MRLIGPDEMEKFYNTCEKRMVDFFATKASNLQKTLALLVLFSAVYLFRFLPHFGNSDHDVRYLHGGIVFLYMIQDSIFCILALAGISQWLDKPRTRNYFYFVTCAAVWAITATTVFEYLPGTWEFFFALGIVPYLCLISWYFLRYISQWKRKWLYTVIFSILFWLPIFFLGVALWHQNPRLIITLLRFKFEFMWISCLVFAFRHPSPDTPLTVALNPINAIQGVIWPYDLRDGTLGERSHLWWSGVWKCILGYAICSLSIWFFNFIGLNKTHSLMFVFMKRNFSLLSEIAGFNVLVGLARCFGYSLRDRTNFAFLSRSPSEFWQRINVYNYLFVLENINLPLYRRFKSRFISTLCGLFFLMPTHFAIHIGATLFLARAHRELAAIFIQFILWFLIVYFSIWIPIFSPRRWGNAFNAWLAIIATYTLYFLSSFGSSYLVRFIAS